MPTPGMPSPVKALGQARPSGASMAPQARCCSPAALQRRLPILAWLPDYSVSWLKMDAIAGLSVGLTVIPQALAYAEVAALPPQVRRLPPLPPRSSLSTVPGAEQKCVASPPDRQGTRTPAPWGPPEGLACSLQHVTALGQTHAPVTALATLVTRRHWTSSAGLPEGPGSMTHEKVFLDS